jgi:signal transduction histidine kinase
MEKQILVSEEKMWSVSFQNFLNTMLKDIMSMLGAECGSLFLFDSENKELVLDSFYNSKNIEIRGLKRKIGEGISGKVADKKLPVLVKDIGNDSRFNQNGFKHYRTSSFISLPLVISEGLIGLVNVADKSSGESFSEKDLQNTITIAKYTCLIIDISNKNLILKKEREAVINQKALLEKYASVGKLAANVVHEVNNPLDGIIRYNNMALFLLEQMEGASVAKEYLLEVKGGLSRIAKITKSLVEFSQLVNSKANDLRKMSEAHSLLDESLLHLKEKIHSGIIVRKNYHKDEVRIHDIGLSHIFVNIMKNALEAMPEKGSLEISTRLDDSDFEVSFKDTGSGIPADIQHFIFEPFFTTKGKSEGMGLGLAICKEIINRYQGQINVVSCFERGSIFTIKIPKRFLENG